MTAATLPMVSPQHRRRGHARRGLALIGAAALATTTLWAAPALAAPATTVCETAGHPATSSEIVARSKAAMATTSRDLAWMQIEFDQATTASPAAWRLREQLDRVAEEAKALDQLGYVAFVRGDATPGSPAQFRAQEEVDRLCD